MFKTKWTNELLQIEADKYDTRQAFRKANSSAYVVARKKGKEFCDELFSHMLPSTSEKKWTFETIKEKALLYNNRRDFRKDYRGANAAAQRLGILDDVYAHMDILPNQTITKTTTQWIKEARAIHGDKYNYELSDYRGAKERLIIICPTHGEFTQEASAHISGRGCRECFHNRGGLHHTKPAIMYYLKINNGEAYKIGITNNTVEVRFRAEDLKKIEVLKTWKFDTGREAMDRETQIKRDFKESQWNGKSLLTSGNTELFSKDILMLDKLNYKG